MKEIRKQLLKIGLGVIILIAVFSPLLVLAIENYVPLAPIEGTTSSNGSTTLSTYLVGIYRTGIAVAGVLAVFMIVWGGFTYISSDSVSHKSEGKEYLQNAVLGLILAIGSYLILYTVNPSLTNLGLNLKPVEKPLELERYVPVLQQERETVSKWVDDLRTLDSGCDGLTGDEQARCLILWQGLAEGRSREVRALQNLPPPGEINAYFPGKTAFEQAQVSMDRAYSDSINTLRALNESPETLSELATERRIQNWYLENIKKVFLPEPGSTKYGSLVKTLQEQRGTVLRQTENDRQIFVQSGRIKSEEFRQQQSESLINRIDAAIAKLCATGYKNADECK